MSVNLDCREPKFRTPGRPHRFLDVDLNDEFFAFLGALPNRQFSDSFGDGAGVLHLKPNEFTVGFNSDAVGQLNGLAHWVKPDRPKTAKRQRANPDCLCIASSSLRGCRISSAHPQTKS